MTIKEPILKGKDDFIDVIRWEGATNKSPLAVTIKPVNIKMYEFLTFWAIKLKKGKKSAIDPDIMKNASATLLVSQLLDLKKGSSVGSKKTILWDVTRTTMSRIKTFGINNNCQ